MHYLKKINTYMVELRFRPPGNFAVKPRSQILRRPSTELLYKCTRLRTHCTCTYGSFLSFMSCLTLCEMLQVSPCRMYLFTQSTAMTRARRASACCRGSSASTTRPTPSTSPSSRSTTPGTPGSTASTGSRHSSTSGGSSRAYTEVSHVG